MNLIEHGIFQDESDYHCHVGFTVKAVYFFSTDAAKKAAQNPKWKTVSSWQPGWNSPTSEGKIPPWHKIDGCVEIIIPDMYIQAANCKRTESTSIKGQKALAIVQSLLTLGMIPLPLSPQEITAENLQIRGLDIIVKTKTTIQVKCDYDCGSKLRGGTGNIYLELKERNPLGRI